MTGTGTQADPYIPTTLTEFITAVGTAGAYVALDSDINAADDLAYTGELTERVEFMAAQVAGGGFVVRGVTVRAQHMIYVTDPCVVQDIEFRDWAHKKVDSLGATIQGYETGRSGDAQYLGDYFSGCRISVVIDCFGWNQLAANYVDFHDCALDIKLVGAGAYYCLNWCGFLRSTVKIDGVYFAYTNSAVNTCTFDRSAFIVENAAEAERGIDLMKSCTVIYSYVAFPQAYTTDIYVTSGSSTVRGSVAAVVDGQNIRAQGFTIATLAQMRDEAWLASVGFLP